MAEINIANSAGRDALVTLEHVSSPRKVRWVDGQGRQVTNIRVLKAPLDRDLESLSPNYAGEDKFAESLIEGDPEIDFEITGMLLRQVSRVYIDRERKIVHKVTPWEIVRDPDGKERERRPRTRLPPNVAADTPLRWTGTFIKKSEAYRRFVFAMKLQLMHINGLTYDFLFNMAKDLQDREALMLLGAGPKSNQPLILRRGSTPYRGFLEGRVQADKYCLLLHLSNLELKRPAESEASADDRDEESA
jgi:hypothetical protein